MKKNFSAMVVVLFCALLVQAQDAPPDANWESDPLDVLEPSAPKAKPETALPEFKELPEAGQAESTPPPDIEAPPTEVAPVERPARKKSRRNKVVAEVAPENLAPDSPDDHKEVEFHRIYKTYNEVPTSEESWEKALGGRHAENYGVQKGDTLSGISTTLFGDPLFWPKVWSLNSNQILNPHEISPGMNVQFFPGSMNDAPTLAVNEQPENIPANMPVPVAPPRTAMEGVRIPEPKKRPALLQKLPGSLPGSRLSVTSKREDNISVDLLKHKFPKSYEYLEFYINDTPVDGVGKITSTELELTSASDFQYIYIQTNSSEKKFVIQKNLTQLEDPRNKGRKAQMVQVQGEIQVLEKVNEAENIYRAIVTKAIQPIEVGSLLIPGSLPMIDPTMGSISSGVGATIMGGQFEKNRALMGQNSLVFLDGGSSQGLQVGQTLAIYADERIRNKSKAVMNDRVIGTMKIVRVTNNFATAYVGRATDDIMIGDYAGKSVTTAANTSQEPVVEERSSGAGDTSVDEFDLDTTTDNSSAPVDAPADDFGPESGSTDSDLEL